MSRNDIIGQLRGSYPPLVTPFGDDGSIDEATFSALVERQCAEGSDGIVVTGTTGEPSVLTLEERARLVRLAVETARGRLPVVAATGSQSHAETVWLTDRAVESGADAVLVVTPYYVRPPQRGLVEYFVDIAGRTSLPFLIYHIPGRAAVSLELDSLAAIVERAPNVVGLKHASADLEYITGALQRVGPDFRIFAGLEHLSLPMLTIGAAGLVNAVGNLVPPRVAALCSAVASNDLQGARRIHDELAEVNAAVFFDTNPIAIKYMMRRMGILPSNAHRLPMMPATPDLARRLDGVLERAGLLPVAV